LSTLSVRLAGDGPEPAPPLIIAARELLLRGPTEPLLRDTADRVLAARRARGAGHVGHTRIADSFRWLLSGEPEAHHRYWSRLLTALARPIAGDRWQLPHGPALLDRPWEVVLWSQQAAPRARLVTASGEEHPIALAQDPFEAQRWSTTLWPREEGWHQLEVDNPGVDNPGVDNPEASRSFFAQQPEPWRSWIQARRSEATRQRIARDQAGRQPPPSASPRRVARPLPRWPAYTLLLLSLAFLWGDERFRGARS
jgi:hypothetical protein